jgi:modification methylase
MIDLKLGAYYTVLKADRADLILTSPPYNIGSASPAKTGKRSKKKGTYDPKSYRGIREYADNLPEFEYQDQQVEFLNWCASHLNEGGTVVYNHKPRRKDMRVIHPMEWILRVPALTLMEEIIWDRGSTHNHSNRMMWPETERLYVLRRTDDPPSTYALYNSRDLPQRSDHWYIPRAAVNGHNAPFSEEMVRAAIEAWSKPGQVVMDPYSGSGTTAVVARDTGRSFVGAELLPEYHKLAMERIND